MTEMEELRLYVAELEEALKGAIWVRRTDVTILRKALPLSNYEARILLYLRQTDVPIYAVDIGNAIHSMDGDEKIVTRNLVTTLVMRIRKKLGADSILSRQGRENGYWISEPLRKKVTKILSDAKMGCG